MKDNKELFARGISELTTSFYRMNRFISRCGELDDLRGISGIQLQALVTLKKGKRPNMTELAEHMLMTRQQLTKTINALEEKGWVKRVADPDNRRHVMIDLTEQGDLYIDTLVKSKAAIIWNMVASLNDNDSVRLLDALAVIREILSKHELNSLEMANNA